ncbi:MAG: hypothetical protein ACPHUF_01585 [Gammaproteobacteria bacterium]
MNETPSTTNTRSKLTLLLVVAVFVMPIAVAWWYATLGADRIGGEMLNHGELLSPPIDTRDNSALSILSSLSLGPGEWAMIYLAREACDPACQAALEKLLTIHTVLGHHGERVRLAATVSEDSAAQTSRRLEYFNEGGLRKALYDGLQPAQSNTAHILFLDWRGQIPIRFDGDAAPAGITKDLKRLLRGSKIN